MTTIKAPYGENARETLWIGKAIDALVSQQEVISVLERLFENCAMVHKHWGDNSNQKEADKATEDAKALLAKVKGNQ
jgi:hypothetical protein